jgi:hypothetical protein
MNRPVHHGVSAARANRRFALPMLIALASLACGGAPSESDHSASAGTTQGGSSSGGSSGATQGAAAGSAGSAASAGTATAGSAGAGSPGGAANAGAGGSAAGAANAGAAGNASGRVCGAQTCGANQYCRAPCSGTGFGGTQSLGDPTCAALPAACNGVGTCECICGSFSLQFCTPGAFEVQCGCP